MKLIHKCIALLSIMIALLFSLQACQKDGKKVVFENPCSPPCWRYITPGQTDQEEVLMKLREMPDVNKKSIEVLGPWNIFDSSTVVQLNSNIKIKFYFIEDKVILISIYDNFDVTYSEAIEHFGDPDVITSARTLGSGPLLTGDSPELYISSMIPEIGIAFGFNTRDISMKSDREINLATKITIFDFYDPKFFESLLDRGLFTSGNTWDFQFWRSKDK